MAVPRSTIPLACAFVSVLCSSVPLFAQRVQKHPMPAALQITAEQAVSTRSNGAGTADLERLAARIRGARTTRAVGSEDGEVIFGAIVGVAIDDTERLLVLDRSGPMVHVLPVRESAFTVGRQGSGPLDLRTTLAVWPERNGALVVADGVLGVKYIDARTPSAKLQRIVSPGTGITGACKTPSGLAVYRPRATDGKLVQRFDFLGTPGVAFGEPYRAGSPLATLIMNEGVVGCLPNGNTLHAVAGLPFVHGYDARGRRLWTLRLTDFTVGVQDETTDEKGRHSIGLSEDTREFSLTTNIAAITTDVAVVQSIYHTTRSLRARKAYERLDTYLVDSRTGRAIFVGANLPVISHARGDQLAAYLNDPYPRAMVMQLAR